MLPNASIKFDNGNLDAVVSSDDGVFGLLASASAVAEKFELSKPYLLKGMKDVALLGITANVDNYKLYNWLVNFYKEAGEGATLWIIGFAKTTKVSDWFTEVDGTAPAEILLTKANGSVSALFTCYSPVATFTSTIINALDDDVPVAIAAAQALAVKYTTENFAAPFLSVLEGYAYSGVPADLTDLTQGSANRVAIMLGSTEKRTATVASLGAATCILAGRLATILVSKNIGEVKAGALSNLTAYLVDTPVEEADVETINDKGFITFRTHVRKAGYYFTDSRLATDVTDDYKYIELRRTIDKAFRLAHSVVSNEILTDFNVTNTGAVDVFYAKSIEALTERTISQSMTASNELSFDSTDKDDLGVIAKMDTDSNVVSSSKVNMSLKVRPRGYARYFEVLLGFNVNTIN